MKKIIFGLLIAGLLAVAAPEFVSAGGDKVRGELAAGDAVQNLESGCGIVADINEVPDVCVTPSAE